MRTADMSDPRSLMIRFPQISGTGSRGHTVSLQGLAKKGALLMGKAKGAEHGKIYLQTDILANIRFADEFSLKTKHLIDEFIRNSGYEMPANEADPDDLPDELFCPDDINSLDLFENQISSIIWTCGFVSDFSFLRIPVFDTNGNIRHNEGISTIEGLYFLGLPWLRKRKSGIVMGIKEDAEFIASHLKAAMK
jgi:putative flavoprotein involved in K+ transport